MKYVLTKEHLHFFHEKGTILFEGLSMGEISWTSQKEFAELASHLFGVHSLRLGMKLQGVKGKGSLVELCPVQGIVGGLLVIGTDRNGEDFSAKRGDVLFFQNDKVISFEEDLLLVFVEERALFCPKEGCAWNNYYRDLGYGPNDHLREPHQPLLVR